MMLQPEKNYDFKKRMLAVHPDNIRDDSAVPRAEEYIIQDGFTVFLPENASDVILTAAKDFQDYLLTSMEVSAMISKKESAFCNHGLRFEICPKQSEDYVISFETLILIRAKNDRGAAQALYCLEDRMNVRKAPFLSREEIRHTFLFSPRMVHPGYGVDEFPNEHLARIAHAGMDAVLVFVKGVNETPSGFLDFNELCYRAARYGIDVYAYSYISCKMHPDEEHAKEVYDSLYGELFRQCPALKGVVLVGEIVYFKSKDEKTYLRDIYSREIFPSDIPHPGFWPCNDYPKLVSAIKQSVRQYKNDADIVFWTYNWGFAPEEDRIALIDSLPRDISLLVTYEMYEKVPRETVWEVCSDYTLSFAGPGVYFKTEAEAAKRNGIRLYAMANTAGQTWDMGLIPYEPMPYQWIKRYYGLRQAQDKWGLSGLMESHHYGFYPSFIGDLSKQAFILEQPCIEDSLKEVLRARFGNTHIDTISLALRRWSDAITYFVPCDDDQYGPFRVGPSFPFSLIKLRKPPSNKYAHFGNNILRNEFPAGQTLASPPPTGRGMLYNLRVRDEIASFEKMLALMEEGVGILETVPESDRNPELCYLINLGKYICCYVKTGIHAKEWFRIRARLLSEECIENFPVLIQKARELLESEKQNATEAISYVNLDSRLGWEPSMDYLGDEKAIRWKIDFIDYVLNTELKHFENASHKKWLAES